VETVYFGGGTPSLLMLHDIRRIIEKIFSLYKVSTVAEITFEANPDDITREKLLQWKAIGINRLSIGVQSFFDEDLQWMNRVHNAQLAVSSVQLAVKYFDNISIDLIYGTPTLTDEKWKTNVEKAAALKVPHLSCYALTVEPKTALQKMIQLKKKEAVDSEQQSRQFLQLMDWAEQLGYEHYEISNFAQPGYRSRHNSSYWQGQHYLGSGPSAHSFNGKSRQWNISNNALYIQSLKQNIVPFEKEDLTAQQKLNEYIMTSLRTAEGINLNYVNEEWSPADGELLLKQFGKYVQEGKGKIGNNHLLLTRAGKLFADGIAAGLFL
jgi:oxygen-independent coproporphyrinogen-3 oxidase